MIQNVEKDKPPDQLSTLISLVYILLENQG